MSVRSLSRTGSQISFVAETAFSSSTQKTLSQFMEYFDISFNFILISSMLYNVLTIPYRIGFERKTHFMLFILDILVDLIFLLDIFIKVLIREKMLKKDDLILLYHNIFKRKKSFNVSLDSPLNGSIQKKKRRKRRRRKKNNPKISEKFNKFVLEEKYNSPFIQRLINIFLKQLIIIEVISLFPLEYILIFLNFPSNVSYWGRTIRLLNLFKFKNLIKIIEKNVIEKLFSPVIFRCIIYFILLFIVIHFFTCYWFYTAKFYSEYNNFIIFDNIKESLLQNGLLSLEIVDYDFNVRIKQYLSSFYFASTFIIGYNAPIPQTTEAAIFSCLILIVGAIFFVIMVGTVSSLLFNLTKSTRDFNDKMNAIELFLKYKKVDYSLKKDIKNYYRVLRRSGNLYSERDDIFYDLDISVRKAISKKTKADLVKKVKLFKDFFQNEFFIEDICLHLKYLLLLSQYTLVQEGSIGKEMYLLIKGSVDVFVGENKVATLKEGSVIGEIALLFPTPRTASIISNEICEVFVLSKDHFSKILDQYEEYRPKFELEAKKRLQELKKIK